MYIARSKIIVVQVGQIVFGFAPKRIPTPIFVPLNSVFFKTNFVVINKNVPIHFVVFVEFGYKNIVVGLVIIQGRSSIT